MEFKPSLLKIVPLTSEYYDENLVLLNSIIKESHYLVRNKEITQEEADKFIETYAYDPKWVYLLSIYDGKVIGHASALPRQEERVSHIAVIGYIVHPKFRRKGVATNLMKSLISEATNKGLKILIAEVVEDNIPSLNILKKFCFEIYGRIENGVEIEKEEYLDLVLLSNYLEKKK
jgi:RimJ/RimL family protein N-acetyltransferase